MKCGISESYGKYSMFDGSTKYHASTWWILDVGDVHILDREGDLYPGWRYGWLQKQPGRIRLRIPCTAILVRCDTS